MKNRQKTLRFATGAIIAALYIVLTYLSALLGLANGAIQLRLSEALCILPVFTPAAIPGLFAGCVLSNILTGCALWDVVLGSLATLIGAIGTYCLRKYKILPLLPPIIANTVIIPPVLMYVYGLDNTYLYFTVTIAVGEITSCGIFGYILRKNITKTNIFNKL